MTATRLTTGTAIAIRREGSASAFASTATVSRKTGYASASDMRNTW